MATENTCSKCRFYDRQTSTCRESSPKEAVLDVSMSGVKSVSYWPTVKDVDWCGKFNSGDFRTSPFDQTMDDYRIERSRGGLPS